MGMLNASQKRTKRAPFTDELMSRQPDAQERNKATVNTLHYVINHRDYSPVAKTDFHQLDSM